MFILQCRIYEEILPGDGADARRCKPTDLSFPWGEGRWNTEISLGRLRVSGWFQSTETGLLEWADCVVNARVFLLH